MERQMLARRWRWSCVYVGANVIAFGLSLFAGRWAGLWLLGLGWLLSMGYLVVILETRTPRGPWGSRLRGELEQPELWRTARTPSGGRSDDLPPRFEVLDAARRDASDWLSGVGITTLLAIVSFLPGSGTASAPPLLFVMSGACVVLTVWGLVRARIVMMRLDRVDARVR